MAGYRRGRKVSRGSSRRKKNTMRVRYDVQPQLFIGTAIKLTAGSNYTVTAVACPIPMPRTFSSTNPVVMELLKIEFVAYGDEFDNGHMDATVCLATSQIDRTGRNALNASIMNPVVINTHRFRGSAAGITTTTLRVTEDMSSNDGRGILVATDKLFFHCQQNLATPSTATGNETIAFRVWYRFMSVGLSEYVGIVNQQQVGGSIALN